MNQFEKEYFEAEAHWEGDMLLDPFNAERIAATTNLIPSDVSSLLDVGCGNGVFLNSLMSGRGKDIHLMGIDRSLTALKYVKANKKEGDITNIEFEDSSFDCVSSLEVIEHLPVTIYNKALLELARVSKKYIIISVPYAENLEDNFTKCPSCKTLFNRDLHLRSFSQEKFKNLFNDYGFRNVSVQKLGKITSYAMHVEYKKIFFQKEFLKWQSPICPICGFQEPIKSGSDNAVSNKKRNIFSYLSAIPKFFWPKKTRYYWILGLFEKTNHLGMVCMLNIFI